MLRRREHKHKLCDQGLHDECKIKVEPEKYEKQLPQLIEKIQHERAEMRLASLKAMNNLFSMKFFDIYIQEYSSEILSSLLDIINEPVSKNELDEALLVSCNFALSSNIKDDDIFPFVNGLLTKLPELTKQEHSKPFTIAFLLYFCSKEHSRIALEHILTLLTNKRQRGSPFDQATIATIINELSLILSIEGNEKEQNEFQEQLNTVLTNAFDSSKYELLSAGVRLLKVMYNNMVINESNKGSDDEYDEEETDPIDSANHFAEKYKNKIVRIAEKVSKKEDKSMLEDEIDDLMNFFTDHKITETIIIDEQPIELTNLSEIFFIDAVRKLTKSNFAHVLSQNKFIHSKLDIKLKPVHIAILHKKNEKKDTDNKRMSTTKTRQKHIAKERNKKEKRL